MTGQTRRSVLKTAAVGTAAIATGGLTGLLRADDPPKTEPVKITIFNTGDIHDKTRNLARIAAHVKAAKAENPNTIFLDAGDMFSNYGDRPIVRSKGDGMFALMVEAGYDGAILGNWDYIYGRQRVLDLVEKYPKMPLLAANIKWPADEAKKWVKLIPPFRIFEFRGVKVAVVGTASHEMKYARNGRLAIYHQTGTLHKYVPYLRKQADIVIAITHQFFEDDWKLACGPNAPDLIVGGHSHGVRNRVCGQEKKSYVIKARAWTEQVGRVDLAWDGKKIASLKGEVLKVAKDWPEDPAVKALRDKLLKPVIGKDGRRPT